MSVPNLKSETEKKFKTTETVRFSRSRRKVKDSDCGEKRIVIETNTDNSDIEREDKRVEREREPTRVEIRILSAEGRKSFTLQQHSKAQLCEWVNVKELSS